MTTGRTKTVRSAGFTLVELILVLVILGVIASLVAPSMRGFADSRQSADAAVRVAAMTHWARSQAVAQGRAIRMNFELDGGRCWLTVQKGTGYTDVEDTAGSYRLPEGVSAVLESAPADPKAPYVQFHPSGRCDAANIQVRGADGRTFTVACAAATERFRVLSPSEASKR